MHLTRSVAGAAVCCWLAPVALAQADEATIARIRAGNSGSVAAFRTLHARFTAVQSNSQKGGGSAAGVTTTVEWWQEGIKIRWVEQKEYTSLNQAKPAKGGNPAPQTLRAEGVVTADGEVKVREMRLSAGGKWLTASGTIKPHSRQDILAIDPWSSALFHLSHTPLATLADLLEDPKRVLKCDAEEIVGQKCYRLRIQSASGDWYHDVVVDPGCNYLVRRHCAVSKSSAARIQAESWVVRFDEPSPGIFFPVEVETQVYWLTPAKTRDEVSTTIRARFTHVAVNEPIDPQLFDLEFSPGTEIYDRRNNTSYIIGKDQKPVGQVSPLPVGGLQSEVKPTYAQQGGWGWPALIAAGVAAALLCGGAWWFIRHRMKAASHESA